MGRSFPRAVEAMRLKSLSIFIANEKEAAAYFCFRLNVIYLIFHFSIWKSLPGFGSQGERRKIES
jgi:hypothetical protein